MRCKMIVITTMLCVMVACQKGQAMPADEDTVKKIANTVLSRPGIKNMTPEQIAILAAREALQEKKDERLKERWRIINEAFENFQFAKALADIDKARMDIRQNTQVAQNIWGIKLRRVDVHGVDWIDEFIDELGEKLHPDLLYGYSDSDWYRATILDEVLGFMSGELRSYRKSLFEFTKAYTDLLSEMIALGN